MTTPFYVGPEQIVREKSEYARRGIARGRSVVALTYADGILFVAETPSASLHKIGEMYDRIGFAAVGRYNEFENLRVAGIRYADSRGYSYDRRDVSGRGLTNFLAQALNAIFLESAKPYEVEVVIGEVGSTPDEDSMYRLTFDGSVAQEQDFLAMGGQSEAITARLREGHQQNQSLADAMRVALAGLAAGGTAGPAGANGASATASVASQPAATLTAANLEVAVLDRTRPRRAFRRINGAELTRLLDSASAATKGSTGSKSRKASAPASADGTDAEGAPSTPDDADS